MLNHRGSISNQQQFWRFSTKGIAVRLFITCWLIYGLHFATNIVREIYPALALGDAFSFRLDEYANLHPDIFEKPGYGWHINNNPGVSFFAAIPYAISRPLIDRVVAWVNQSRAANGQTEPPAYDSPWPLARQFFAEAWRKGYDIKFALAAFVMQFFFMAPLTALSAVALFDVLRRLFHSNKTGLGLALLYAFGTPVFFRTGTLNQNLSLGILAFFSFLLLWNYSDSSRFEDKTRYFLAGVSAGTAVLFDYSGLIFLIGLFIYGALRARRNMLPGIDSRLKAITLVGWFLLGGLGPVCLLWFYQWKSFGSPFLPAQHWMNDTNYSGFGYQGIGLPQLDLIFLLMGDLRYGLLSTSPILLLAFFAPFINRGKKQIIPTLETVFILALFVGLWLFLAANNYSRLQFNSGVRYLTAIIPFLFLLVSITLMRLPTLLRGLVAVVSIYQSWSLAMYRDVENHLGVLGSLLRLTLGGFNLPVLETISRFQGQTNGLVPGAFSPIAVFVFVAALLVIIWLPPVEP